MQHAHGTLCSTGAWGNNCKQNAISLQRTVEPAPMPMGTPPALMSASRCEWGGRGVMGEGAGEDDATAGPRGERT